MPVFGSLRLSARFWFVTSNVPVFGGLSAIPVNESQKLVKSLVLTESVAQKEIARR